MLFQFLLFMSHPFLHQKPRNCEDSASPAQEPAEPPGVEYILMYYVYRVLLIEAYCQQGLSEL